MTKPEGGEEAMSAITIDVCRDVSEELCQALARLVPQLSSATIPSENDVREVAHHRRHRAHRIKARHQAEGTRP